MALPGHVETDEEDDEGDAGGRHQEAPLQTPPRPAHAPSTEQHLPAIRGTLGPVLDRHELFASTVPLAGSRAGSNRRPRSGKSTALGSSPSMQSLQWSSVQGGNSISTHDWSVMSKESRRSTRSRAVSIRLSRLQREDAFPCPNTGRRTRAAPDRKIRIFVRLPCQARLAIWLDPDLPVGPPPRAPPNWFTDYWGEDAELRGPLASREKEGGRLTPVRELLAKQASVVSLADPPTLTQRTTDTSRSRRSTTNDVPATPAFSSLKGLLEAATGVAVPQQKLVFGGAGPLDEDGRSLCDYGIGHGAFLYLAVRPEPGVEGIQHLASPALASTGFREPGLLLSRVNAFMNSKVGPKMGKDFVQALPEWRVVKPTPVEVEWPQEVPYFDYSGMHDNYIFDLTGRVRKRFRELPRVARSVSVKNRTEATPPFTAR